MWNLCSNSEQKLRYPRSVCSTSYSSEWVNFPSQSTYSWNKARKRPPLVSDDEKLGILGRLLRGGATFQENGYNTALWSYTMTNNENEIWLKVYFQWYFHNQKNRHHEKLHFTYLSTETLIWLFLLIHHDKKLPTFDNLLSIFPTKVMLIQVRALNISITKKILVLESKGLSLW